MANNNFNISVKADFEKVRSALAGAQRRHLKASTVAALNRAVQSGKAEAIRQIKDQRALPVSMIRREVRTTKANYAYLTARLIINYSPIRLAHYRVHNTRRGQGPISVQVLPNEGYKPIERAWVRHMPGGDIIFQRVGKAHDPIKPLYGPSLPSVIGKPGVADKIDSSIDSTWTRTFTQQITYRLSNDGFTVKTTG